MLPLSYRFALGATATGALLLAIACGSSSGNASGSPGNDAGDGGEPPPSCDAGCIDGQVTTGPPGQLDPSFGTRGVTRVPITNEFASSSTWVGMKRGDDGSLFVVYAGSSKTAVAHLHADGSVDEPYGTDRVGLAIVSGLALAFGVDGTGCVLLLQWAPGDGGTTTPTGYVLTRLTPAGATDTTFGNGGVAGPFVDTPAFSPHFLVPRADGKTLLVGFVDNTPGAAFALHGPDGARDPGFGIKSDTTPPASPTDVVTLGDGSIVVLTVLSGLTQDDAGAYTAYTNASLRHYDPNGALDPSFGTGGAVAVPLPENGGRETTGALALAAPGSGILYGFAVSPQGDGGVYAGAFRATAQGAPDTTFAGTGMAIVSVDPTSGTPSVSAAAAAGDRVALGGFRETHVGSGHVWLAEVTQDPGFSAAFDQGVAGDGGFATSAGAYDGGSKIREPGSGKLIVGGVSGSAFYVARVFP